jgi:hypothetical protein
VGSGLQYSYEEGKWPDLGMGTGVFFIAAAAEDMSLISGTKFFGCWLLFVLYIWGVSTRRAEDFLSREKSW